MRENGWAYGAIAVLCGLGLVLSDDTDVPTFVPTDTDPPPILARAPDPSAALQDAFIGFLSGDAGNLAAEETVRFLKSHAVHLRLHDPGSPRVLAEYDSEAGNLNLNPTRTVPAGLLTALRPVSDFASRNLEATIAAVPSLLKKYVDVTARLVVHETHHGSYTEAVGTDWNSREQELACRSYETLFLLRRLQNERDFLRLEEFDRYLMDEFSAGPKVSGPVEFERPERWWAVPLGDVSLRDVEQAARRIRDRHPGAFSDELEYHWYLLHRLSEGADAYWTILESMIPADYESVDQDWPAHLARLEADYRRHPTESLKSHLDSDRAFLASQERVDAYRAYFRLEKRRLGLLLQAASTPA